MANPVITAIGKYALQKITNNIVAPIDTLVDDTITDFSTTIGSFVVRQVRGKFQRSITFSCNVGTSYWMEEALYGILYKYNNIKTTSRLSLTNGSSYDDGSALYYQLDDGVHNLKYRKWSILVSIQTIQNGGSGFKSRDNRSWKEYTIICFDLDPDFPKLFEKDMLAHRNSMLKINADSPVVNVYKDYPDASDGFVYWEKIKPIMKRPISTIYLPREKKQLIVDTVNKFFANREFYAKHAIPHNLKILLYGPPGPQPIDTKIPTPDGMKRFGDLNVGDYVFDRTGNPTQVLEIHPKGIQRVYDVKLEDGRTTRCTIDHLWNVYHYDKSANKYVSETVPLGWIMNNMPLYSDSSEKIFIPRNQAVSFNDSQTLQMDPYVYGTWVAASEPVDTSSMMCIMTPDLESVEKIIRRTNWYADIQFKDGEFMTVFSSEDGEPIMPFGIDDYNIRSEYIFTSIENRLDFLDGYLSVMKVLSKACADELHCNPESFVVPAMNEKTAHDLNFMLRSLGVPMHEPIHIDYTDVWCSYSIPADVQNLVYGEITRKYEYHPVIKKILDHRIKLNHFKYRAALEEQNETLYGSMIANEEYVAIKSIIPAEDSPVMCILVDNDEHLYLTNDFIVTHNTGKDSIAKMIASEWNRNIYYVSGGKTGQYIPNAIISSVDVVNHPMFLISDIDKYPFLINEADINIDAKDAKDDQMKYKQAFGSMINALDGVMAPNDRIIVMTTNHIEKFSDTFTRPGRIDLKLEIGYVTPEVFRKYVYDFYHQVIPKDIKLAKDDITIAELQREVVFMESTLDEFLKKFTR